MNKITLRILTLGWSLLILFLTLLPDTGGKEFWLLKIQGMDKVVHFGLFFILSFLFLPASNSSFFHYRYSFILTIIYGVLLSALTEYGQMYVAGRSGDVFDFFVDTIGVLCGVLISDRFLFKKT